LGTFRERVEDVLNQRLVIARYRFANPELFMYDFRQWSNSSEMLFSPLKGPVAWCVHDILNVLGALLHLKAF